ncbi:hypothetical protein NK662_23005, partial [Ectobacillus sp. SYSU M60031]|nr:hypothetical protein [Ectobacillus ponti]
MWIEMHSLMAADWVDAATAAEKGERGEEEEKRGGAERGEYEDAFLCGAKLQEALAAQSKAAEESAAEQSGDAEAEQASASMEDELRT